MTLNNIIRNNVVRCNVVVNMVSDRLKKAKHFLHYLTSDHKHYRTSDGMYYKCHE